MLDLKVGDQRQKGSRHARYRRIQFAQCAAIAASKLVSTVLGIPLFAVPNDVSGAALETALARMPQRLQKQAALSQDDTRTVCVLGK